MAAYRREASADSPRHDLRADGRHRPRPALGPHLGRLRRRPATWCRRSRSATVRASRARTPVPADSIMASVKHFALYGAVEGGRDYNTVDMSPMRMYKDYLPPYRAAIDAGAGGVMVALNSINGVPATSNTWLMQDLLRKDWGFKGVTVSDHGAIVRTDAPRRGQGRARGRQAGHQGRHRHEHGRLGLPEGAARPGEVRRSEHAEIDNAVREVLGAKYDMGLFHNPYLRIGKAKDDPADLNADSRLHRAPRARSPASRWCCWRTATDAAAEEDRTIALVGPLADAQIDMLGSWSAAGFRSSRRHLAPGSERAVGQQGRLLYARGANITNDEDRRVPELPELGHARSRTGPAHAPAMIDEAVAAARQADVIVAAVGEARGMSHESSSRTSLDLPPTSARCSSAQGHRQAAGAGADERPSPEPELGARRTPMRCWRPGSPARRAAMRSPMCCSATTTHRASCRSLSRARSARSRPTTTTAPGPPVHAGQAGQLHLAVFRRGKWPLYPFGYGLSYTDFACRTWCCRAQDDAARAAIEASVTVKNMGQRAGETVVQLYIQDVAASVVRPVKELKDFRKVACCKAGEETGGALQHRRRQAEVLQSRKLQNVAEAGTFKVQIGLDSQNVQQSQLRPAVGNRGCKRCSIPMRRPFFGHSGKRPACRWRRSPSRT
jgi:beta-glucosidase